MKIDVKILNINAVKGVPQLYCQKHFPKRTQRTSRFIKNEDKLRSIGAGVLLNNYLKVNECDILYNEHQKPYLKEKYFNISHSGNYVILATSSGEIGCDIEMIDVSHLSVAKNVYLDDEQIWLNEDPENRFFILWTLKESVMKKLGLGLSLNPKSFSVMPIIEGKSITVNGSNLYALTKKFDNYYISVCTDKPIDEFIVEDITEDFKIKFPID